MATMTTTSNSYRTYLNSSVNDVTTNFSSSTSYFTTLYYQPNTQWNTYDKYDNITCNYYFEKKKLTIENVTKTSFITDAEEKIEEYIKDHFDKYDILDDIDYVYQTICEKAYDIVEEILDDVTDDYDICDKDSIIDTIIQNIDFNSLYETVDDILCSPRTMEEKMADVGMSERDFF